MSSIDTAKEIREILKEKGFTNRRVSVVHSWAGYSASIDIKIKDLTIKRAEIEEIAYKFKEVRREERTGEILEGGNLYIFVKYDSEKLETEAEKQHQRATEIFDRFSKMEEGQSGVIARTENYEYMAFARREGISHIYRISLDDNKQIDKQRYLISGVFDLAEFLVLNLL